METVCKISHWSVPTNIWDTTNLFHHQKGYHPGSSIKKTQKTNKHADLVKIFSCFSNQTDRTEIEKWSKWLWPWDDCWYQIGSLSISQTGFHYQRSVQWCTFCRMGDSQHEKSATNLQQLHDAIMSTWWSKISKTCFKKPSWIHAKNNSGCSGSKGGSWPELVSGHWVYSGEVLLKLR